MENILTINKINYIKSRMKEFSFQYEQNLFINSIINLNEYIEYLKSYYIDSDIKIEENKYKGKNFIITKDYILIKLEDVNIKTEFTKLTNGNIKILKHYLS